MSLEPDEAKPMVSVTLEPEYRIRIDEICGIAHERQILEVAIPASEESQEGLPDGTAPLLFLKDRATARIFPAQRSRSNPQRGFLLIGISPGEVLELEPAEAGGLSGDVVPVTLTNDEDANYILANGKLALRLNGEIPPGVKMSTAPEPWFGRSVVRAGIRRNSDETFARGPVQGVRSLPLGKWRGRTTFDTRGAIVRWDMQTVQHGPLRTELRFCSNPARPFGASAPEAAERTIVPKYEATFTLDAGADFVRISERWEDNTRGEQIVWDFSGPDLPSEILRLDSTAGCAIEPLQYFYDHRTCRLFAWTQQSQLSDLSDGFALTFDADDAIGFVTLEGGSWRGNRLNHLEAWSRRWIGDNPASRRGVPDAAKRDVFPSPERIPARGESRTAPHLNVEGWIGESGERTWALVAARTADLMPGAGAAIGVAEDRGCSVERRHFENSPDRERDRLESSRLRRIHTQRGLLPLSTLAGAVLRWPSAPDAPPAQFTYPNPVIEEHLKHRDKDAPVDETWEMREGRRKLQMIESLAARVYGFWEGGASGATNPVVSRDVAPRMLQYEYLAGSGQFNAAENEICRAHFAFLTYLFGSDNYYPGMATMLPAEHPDSVEPTLEGMANQNFYTDVVNVCGMAAQVFPDHPAANAWRTRFSEHWARQMAYHTYPNSGVWEESHTYFQHVLRTVLPTLLRRRDDGVGDGFGDPSLQRLLRGAVRQVVPRDDRFGGDRYLAPFGDHSAGHAAFAHLYKPLAEAVKSHDRELGGHLIWMYRELGGHEASTVEPIVPPLKSEYVEGLGYFLRGHDDNGQELLLALRAGSAWGHHHHDEGSIQFWARGLSLIVDAGFGEWSAGKRKFNDSGHSRWGLNDYPANNFGYRFNRGWIMAHDASEPFPYAIAHAPIYLQAPAPGTVVSIPGHAAPHRRAIVRIGPCAFLVVDVAETGLGQTVRFHIPETTDVVGVDGGISVTYSDDCVLTLLSALPDQAPLALAAADSLAGGKSTLEIAAAVSPTAGKSRVVYLIAAESKDGTKELRITGRDGGDATLTGRGIEVRLDWPEHGLLRITNLNPNPGERRERLIDISAPARCVS